MICSKKRYLQGYGDKKRTDLDNDEDKLYTKDVKYAQMRSNWS
jgi:hypothetical protein